MGAVQDLVAPVSSPTAGFARAPVYTGPERRDSAAREQLVRRVRKEFEEMPGLCLTFEQAKLLFGLEAGCCERVLYGLLQSGFLIRTKAGLYGRRDLVV
jgi:hypothetical protein